MVYVTVQHHLSRFVMKMDIMEHIASHLFANYFTALENHSLQFAVAKANEALQSKMLAYEVDTRKRAFGAHVSRQFK